MKTLKTISVTIDIPFMMEGAIYENKDEIMAAVRQALTYTRFDELSVEVFEYADNPTFAYSVESVPFNSDDYKTIGQILSETV
jgi:hypothetical protein